MELFFLAVYVVLAIPFIGVLATLAWILRKGRVARAKSIATFSAVALLALTPFATQMASLYVGIAPMGYVILSIPFEGDGAAAFYLRVFLEFVSIHLVGMVLIGIASLYVAHRLFPNSRLQPTEPEL